MKLIMIEVTKQKLNQWSRMGMRAIVGQFIFDLATNNNDVLAISADLGRSSGLDRMRKTLPLQYVNVGIAEQNMVGFASGLSREGFKVYATSFAPFIAMRASEQVRMNLGYMQEPVKLIAIGSGLSMGFLGNSHYGIEDLSVMRSIPNMNIFCPSDCLELYKIVNFTYNFEKPIYIRLTGIANTPLVHEADFDFKFGEANSIIEGQDICLISNGSITGVLKEAVHSLKEQNNISCSLYSFHTVKPLDTKTLSYIMHRFKNVIIAEEGTIVGGLSSAISEFLVDNNFQNHLFRLGIKDEFVSTGDYQYLLNEIKITKDDIIKLVKKILG